LSQNVSERLYGMKMVFYEVKIYSNSLNT